MMVFRGSVLFTVCNLLNMAFIRAECSIIEKGFIQ